MSVTISQTKPPLDNWASIETAINARASYLQAELRLSRELPTQGIYEDWDHPYMDHARGLARVAALQARSPGRVPGLLADVEILAIEFWAVAEDMRDSERSNALDAMANRAASERAAMAACGDWAALGLPSPTALRAVLLSGDRAEVAGHALSYEEDLGVTWYTNPYGIDGAICREPTEDALRSFLTDMAVGTDYGPVP